MNNSSGARLALAAAGAIASLPAAGTPVTLSQTVSLGNVLSGNSAALSFDVSSFLAGQGYTAANVVGGSVSVFGFSEASYGAAQANPYSGYEVTGYTSHTAYYSYYVYGYQSCSWWGGCYYYGGYYATAAYGVQDVIETRLRDVNHIDNLADQLQVSAGNSSATSSVASVSSSVGAYGAQTYEGSICSYTDGNGNCSFAYRYNRERDVYQAVFGGVQTALVLDAAAVGGIQSSGQLALTVGAPLGHVSLNGYKVNLDVEPQAVAEPATLALSGIALAAALAVGRRRRMAAVNAARIDG